MSHPWIVVATNGEKVGTVSRTAIGTDGVANYKVTHTNASQGTSAGYNIRLHIVPASDTVGLNAQLGTVHTIDVTFDPAQALASRANLWPVYNPAGNRGSGELVIACASRVGSSTKTLACIFRLTNLTGQVYLEAESSSALTVPASDRWKITLFLFQASTAKLCGAVPVSTPPCHVVIWDIDGTGGYHIMTVGSQPIVASTGVTLLNVRGTVYAFYGDANSYLICAWMKAWQFVALLGGQQQDWTTTPVLVNIDRHQLSIASTPVAVYDPANSQIIAYANSDDSHAGPGWENLNRLAIPLGADFLPSRLPNGQLMAAQEGAGMWTGAAGGPGAVIDNAGFIYSLYATSPPTGPPTSIQCEWATGKAPILPFQKLFEPTQTQARLADFGACLVPAAFLPLAQGQVAAAAASEENGAGGGEDVAAAAATDITAAGNVETAAPSSEAVGVAAPVSLGTYTVTPTIVRQT